jgi:phosphomannomutase
MDPGIIRFGTDGWRDVLGGGFTFDNAALVACAIAQQLEEDGQQGKQLLVGYDNRFQAEQYAAHLAAVFSSRGWEVLLADAPLPTPALAVGVQQLKAAGAVMLTASHNPHVYQGLKFIPHFAGPAMPDTTNRITALIREHAAGFKAPPLALDWRGECFGFRELYFKQLDSMVNQHSLSAASLRILYNPMHGTGAGYLDAYLNSNNVEVVSINSSRDVYFGNSLPDPSPANLAGVAAAMQEHNCQILLATDGDADRFGILDADGLYFGANQCLPLLADYLLTYRQQTGALVRTVATSHLLDGIASRHNLPLVETPVGFKYVGEQLRAGALVGGEESGGVSVKGHVPEKDGILALVLLLELISTAGESLHHLLAELQRDTGRREYLRIDQPLSAGDSGRLLAALENWDAGSLASRKIVKRQLLDGCKFVLEDGSWVMFRASGTEPLVRVYIEAVAPEKTSVLKAKAMELMQSLLS